MSDDRSAPDQDEVFWRNRFERYGHTGWANDCIYAFDQLYRLTAFRAWLMERDAEPSTALDFGCGTGDFSRELIKFGYRTVAYDPFVKASFAHYLLKSTSEWTEIPRLGPYDLIVSVTVLDHILDDAEFHGTLSALRDVCAPGAQLFLIEYSSEVVKSASAYQSFRSMQTWKTALEASGFTPCKETPAFHPEEGQTPAWAAYRRDPLVRVAGKLSRLGAPRSVSRGLYNFAAQRVFRAKALQHPQASPLHAITAKAGISL